MKSRRKERWSRHLKCAKGFLWFGFETWRRLLICRQTKGYRRLMTDWIPSTVRVAELLDDFVYKYMYDDIVPYIHYQLFLISLNLLPSFPINTVWLGWYKREGKELHARWKESNKKGRKNQKTEKSFDTGRCWKEAAVIPPSLLIITKKSSPLPPSFYDVQWEEK